jgi:hypothetical protein
VAVVVAGYAAVVGTASLVWQIHSSRVAARPGVTAEIKLACVGYPSGAVWTVEVQAINAGGQRPVGVTGAGLCVQDQSGASFVLSRIGPPSTIPGTVEPQHRLSAFFEVAVLESNGFDLKRPLVGFVNLATGQTVRAKPMALRS